MHMYKFHLHEILHCQSCYVLQTNKYNNKNNLFKFKLKEDKAYTKNGRRQIEVRTVSRTGIVKKTERVIDVCLGRISDRLVEIDVVTQT